MKKLIIFLIIALISISAFSQLNITRRNVTATDTLKAEDAIYMQKFATTTNILKVKNGVIDTTSVDTALFAYTAEVIAAGGNTAGDFTINGDLYEKDDDENYNLIVTKSAYCYAGIADYTIYTLPIPDDAVVQLFVKFTYINEIGDFFAAGTWVTDYEEGIVRNVAGTLSLTGMYSLTAARGNYSGGNPIVTISGTDILIQWQQTSASSDAGVCTVHVDAFVVDSNF